MPTCPTLPYPTLPYFDTTQLYPTLHYTTLPYPTLHYTTLPYFTLLLPCPTLPTLHYTTKYPTYHTIRLVEVINALPRVYWGVQVAARRASLRPAHPSTSGRAHNILGTMAVHGYPGTLVPVPG